MILKLSNYTVINHYLNMQSEIQESEKRNILTQGTERRRERTTQIQEGEARSSSHNPHHHN